MVLIVSYSKKEAKGKLEKYGNITYESKIINMLFLELDDENLDRSTLLNIDGVTSVEEESTKEFINSDIKFYVYINGVRKYGSLQEVHDIYCQGSNKGYKAIGVDFINPFSKMDSSIDLLISNDGVEKISNDYISLNLQENLKNAVIIIESLFETNKNCLDCSTKDKNNCKRHNCANFALLNKDEIGISGLKQLEKRCNEDLVTSMSFKTNVIGYEWIDVVLNTGETYEISLSSPKLFKLKTSRLEEFVDTVENVKLCLFIADILKYKKQNLN